MKFLPALLSVTCFAAVANAHVLDQSHGIVDQLSHQVLGVHHLPLLLLIGLAASLMVRAIRRRGE